MTRHKKPYPMHDDSRWLALKNYASVSEIAAEFNYSRRTVRGWCDEGLVIARKIYGQWIIDRTSVADLCRKRREKPS